MLMRRLVCVVVIVVSAAFAGADLGVAARLGHDDPHARRVESEVGRLINRARSSGRAHRECNPRFGTGRTRVVHGAPDSRLLAILAPLRRPPSAEDRVGPSSFAKGPFFSRIYVDYIRVLHAADGTPITLTPVQPAKPPIVPHTCVSLWHEQLVALLSGQPGQVRRQTLAEERRLNREERPDRPRVRRDGVLLIGPDGGGGGGDATSVRRYGEFNSGGGRRINGGHGSIVTGLVPDGVASITFTYPRQVSRGPYRDPKTYPSAITLTEPVHDNVVRFAVERSAEDAFAPRMVWRDATGKTIRVVHSPFS